MSQKRMLVNVHDDETRIALTEDRTLVDLHIEQTTRGRTAGNIYVGKIVKVNPSFQAAFVEYGENKNGFLSISDLNPSLFPQAAGGRGRIQSMLKNGQWVTVQVLKEGVGSKGAALSTNIALPGRYLVLSPHNSRGGVSRKIDDADQRDRLKEFLAGLSTEGMGVIVRTAGIDRTLTDLKRDFAALRRQWKSIQDEIKKTRKPGLVYREAGSVVRVLRDYFSEDMKEVWVDSAEVYQQALEYFKANMPKFQKRLKLYVEDRPIFSAYQVEDQFEALDSDKAQLESGGSIVIEPTEAMVSIDVNSGRSNQESDIEETALRTNLEAAAAIGRQLRLRNLGGLIVVDFIDMFLKKNQAKVEQALAAALKDDKARVTLGKISQFGLMELSRQRIDMELSRGLRVQCPGCGGTGHVPTVNASANNILRKIREIAAQGKFDEIHAEMPLENANFMLNSKRENLTDLELEFGIKVYFFANPELPPGHPIRLEGRTTEGDVEETEDKETARPTASLADEPAADGSPKRRRSRRGGRRGQGAGAAERETPAERESPPAAEEAEESDAMMADYGVVDDQEAAPAEGDDGKGDEEEIADAVPNLADEEEIADAVPNLADAKDIADAVPNLADAKQPAAAISPTHLLPTEFTLGRRTGRRPTGFGASTLPGEAIFQSTHLPDKEDGKAVLFPTVNRTSPFTRLAAEAEVGDIIFDSESRGGNGADLAEEAPEKAPAKRRRSWGRRAPAKTEAEPRVAQKAPSDHSEQEATAGDEAAAENKAGSRRERKPAAE